MENILLLIAGIVIAAYLGRRIIPKILIISLRKKLFDVPDGRKVHKRPVPRLGGVTFFPVILFVICILTMYRVIVHPSASTEFSDSITTEMFGLFAGLTLLYIIGIGDDLVGIRYRNKFKIQILVAALFPIAGLYINNFYGLLGIHELTPYIGIPLTMLLVIFITNAINLIDGIDGLASSICIVALSTFGILFAQNQVWLYAQTALICVGVLIPFFIYNVFGDADRGRKIFMGDTGSLTLGYILSFLVIKHCMYIETGTANSEGAPIIVAFCILLVPCLDVIRVVIGRIRRGKSPFLPDKTHIHHKFMAMGFSQRASLILIQCISMPLIVVNILLNQYGVDVNLIFFLDITVWTGLNIWFTKVIKSKQG
jgi:UDP-N-acetylmuramyl pentapeptide phosphotransferase/UDP-N-acetylglucosamine-1-phosphate transferase